MDILERIDDHLKESQEMDFTWELMSGQMDDFMKLLKMEMPSQSSSNYNRLMKQYQAFKKQLTDFVKSIS